MSDSANTPSKGIINGPIYNVARFSTEYLNVPPNKHRLYNAIGLMAGLYVGRKVMNILAGETPEGKKVNKDDLIGPARPLHGLLAYDHFSDDPKQRWMKVFDMMVPGILGGLGAMSGSYMFFREPIFLLKSLENLEKMASKDFSLTHAEQIALGHEYDVLSKISAAAAVPGSASGLGLIPSANNYSSTLGGAFTVGAERSVGAPGMRGLFNSHSSFPFRWHKLIGKMTEYLAGNPAIRPERLDEYANGILKPLFKGITAEQIGAFKKIVLEERDKVLAKGLSGEALEKAITGSMKRLFGDADTLFKDQMMALGNDMAKKRSELIAKGVDIETITTELEEMGKKGFKKAEIARQLGFEKTLMDAGIDPREANIGDTGVSSVLSRWFGDAFGAGTSKKLEKNRQRMIKAIEERHGGAEAMNQWRKEKGLGVFDPHKAPTENDSAKIAAGTLLGVSAVSLGAVAMAKDTSIKDLAVNGDIPEEGEGKHSHRVHSKHRHGIINGKLLDTAEGVTGMLNAGIGSHRVHCAVGLTAGSWLGDKVMDALTGVKFNGAKVKEEDVWKPLRKVYKKLAFNPHSDHMNDKWMQVLRWGVPGILGGLAVVQASRIFFEERHEKVQNSRFLDEAEDKATHAQATPWTYTAAVSSLFGFPSGLPMLPLANYSTNLGTRFSMASGRKVSMPGLGKIWSNNPTLFPFGPSGMIDLLVKESVNNKSFDPELLETYAIGILKPWFDKVTPQQVHDFVMEVHKVRDQFFKEGGVPEDLKEQLKKEMNAHFHGAGLEETLQHIGLNPAMATLANNGWSGAIANTLGASKEVSKIKRDYLASYTERLQKNQLHAAEKSLTAH